MNGIDHKPCRTGVQARWRAWQPVAGSDRCTRRRYRRTCTPGRRSSTSDLQRDPSPPGRGLRPRAGGAAAPPTDRWCLLPERAPLTASSPFCVGRRFFTRINEDRLRTICASQFRLFPTFLLSVPLLVVIWSYRGPRTRLQLRNRAFCVTGTVSHCTFVPHLHYQLSKTCSSHLFSRDYTSLTVSGVRTANILQKPCSDSSHVRAPYKSSFY